MDGGSRRTHLQEYGSAQLRDRLEHVYWIGGGSGAGKSTIAAHVADRYGLDVYATDDVMGEHARRSTPEETPYLRRFAAMDMDERWVNRSPETMLDTFHWYRGEGFDLLVEDLLALPTDRGLIAEGFRLLPELVAPLLAEPRRAVWLLPTPEFRRAAFESRGALWQIAGRTSDPERALRNLLDRDRMFTERLDATAAGLSLPVIHVEPAMTEDHLAARVADSFGR
jgi:2-phosphoglycerate kinase